MDGWEGNRLAISAEVKQYVLSKDTVANLEAFGNATGRRGTLGVVTALGFAEGVREQLYGLGLLPLDRENKPCSVNPARLHNQQRTDRVRSDA